MSWEDVRIFVVVAEQKSISKAATILNVTPGMVSRRVDELEEALDVRLLIRSPQGTTLTAAGEDVLNRALSMQRFADSIEEQVRGLNRRDEGMVTLRAPDGFTGYWIAPRVPEFQNENPKIQLTLDCGTLTDYVAADPDILITADKDQAELGDIAEPIAVLHYLFVAGPKYLETYGTPKSIAGAVAEHRTLRHVGQTHQRESWDARTAAIESIATFSVVTNSSHALMQVALAGGGLCTIPSAMCHLHPEVVILGPDRPIPIKLWLVVRRHAQSSTRVQRVAHWLKATFDTKFNPWFRDEYVSPDQFEAELVAARGRIAPEAHERGLGGAAD